MAATRLFCDESGFTGPDLLGPSPYFTYASVAIEDDEAKELVQRIIRDYRVQGLELKGRKLLQFARERRAVADIFNVVEGRVRTAVFEKRFALACKLYEYVFEPVLASHSSIFYALRFHLFIANLMYLHFLMKGRYAERSSWNFRIS